MATRMSRFFRIRAPTWSRRVSIHCIKIGRLILDGARPLHPLHPAPLCDNVQMSVHRGRIPDMYQINFTRPNFALR